MSSNQDISDSTKICSMLICPQTLCSEPAIALNKNKPHCHNTLIGENRVSSLMLKIKECVVVVGLMQLLRLLKAMQLSTLDYSESCLNNKSLLAHKTLMNVEVPEDAMVLFVN